MNLLSHQLMIGLRSNRLNIETKQLNSLAVRTRMRHVLIDGVKIMF